MHRAYLALLLFVALPLSAQEAPAGRDWIDFGLKGLGLRGGVSLSGDGQGIAGATVDIGDLFTDQLRFRLVGELGFAPSPNTYTGSFELVYRFTPDSEMAVPYLGMGLGVAGSEVCGTLPDCPSIWLQFALGFELALNDAFNWLIEYHPQDALRQHRVFVGFSTRRRDR